jgi:hypothetical protein
MPKTVCKTINATAVSSLRAFLEKSLEKAWGGVYNHPSPNQVVRLEMIAIISGHAQPPKGIFVKLLFARIEKCPR